MINHENIYFKDVKCTEVIIYGEKKSIIAKLIPINNLNYTSNDIIISMTKWRNKFNTHFLTRFLSTNERTINWIEKSILYSNNRILYLIYVEEKLVGQFGLCNITNDQAELDNVIRGERGGCKDLFELIEIEIIKLSFEKLKIKRVVAHILSNNFLAYNLHEKNGFVIQHTFPLKKYINNEMEIMEISSIEESNIDLKYIQLIFKK